MFCFLLTLLESVLLFDLLYQFRVTFTYIRNSFLKDDKKNYLKNKNIYKEQGRLIKGMDPVDNTQLNTPARLNLNQILTIYSSFQQLLLPICKPVNYSPSSHDVK